MPPRIFLSHSTHETGDMPILEHLQKLLVANGFQVFVDKDSLQAGELWRPRLIRELGICHGAVVLINERALLPEKKWVETEANILRWRSWNEDENRFKVLLVRIGDVTADRISRAWPALDHSALQMLPKGSGRLDADKLAEGAEVFEAIIQALRPLHQSCGPPTPLQQLRDAIADHLRSVVGEANHLHAQYAARDLGVTDEQFLEQRDPFVHLANLLLEQGVAPNWVNVVLKRVSAMLYTSGGAQRLTRALNLAVPHWVHPAAAEPLAMLRDTKLPRPVIRINGRLPSFTGPHFIQRACCCAPDSAWKHIEVNPKVGSRAVDSVLEQVRKALRSQMIGLPTDSDADLKCHLVRRNRPVFVILPAPLAGDSKVIQAIRDTFEELTVICLADTTQPLATSNVRDVTPQLDPSEEQDVYYNYLDALAIISDESAQQPVVQEVI